MSGALKPVVVYLRSLSEASFDAGKKRLILAAHSVTSSHIITCLYKMNQVISPPFRSGAGNGPSDVTWQIQTSVGALNFEVFEVGQAFTEDDETNLIIWAHFLPHVIELFLCRFNFEPQCLEKLSVAHDFRGGHLNGSSQW